MRGVHRASLLVLSAGLLVSLGLHLAVAAGAGGYLSRLGSGGVGSAKAIELPEDAMKITPPEQEKIELGRQHATRASITWLGVVEDPVESDGPESTVEQAQFTTQEGNAAQTSVTDPAKESQITPPAPAPAQEAMPEAVAQTQIELQDAPSPTAGSPEVASPEPVEAEPTPVEQVQAPRRDDPEVVVQTQPEPEPEPKAEQPTTEQPEPEAPVGPSLVRVEPERVDNDAPPVDEPERVDESVRPSEVMGPTRPTEATPAEQQPASNATEQTQVSGKQGVVSDRESTASILKRAIPVKAKDLNQPIAGKGLEIVTVDPKFPASVRFTQLPHNPVVLIRFNAQGRVANARFLRDEVKRKTFDTGSRAVDEPLLNAIYQWRAKGEELEKLDAADPESTIEISMKILFRDKD